MNSKIMQITKESLISFLDSDIGTIAKGVDGRKWYLSKRTSEMDDEGEGVCVSVLVKNVSDNAEGLLAEKGFYITIFDEFDFGENNGNRIDALLCDVETACGIFHIKDFELTDFVGDLKKLIDRRK